MTQVIVIGGGLAGLSSAVALANAGIIVNVYERRSVLGGRASSFIHPSTGRQIDNCQHVLLGCCVNLIDFFNQLGVSNQITFHEAIPFIDESNQISVIKSSRLPLPPPLHLLPSFLRLKTMGIMDKLSVFNTVSRMIRHVIINRKFEPLSPENPISMENWLKSHGASSRAIEAFWKPFLISALNDDLDDIDANYGINTSARALMSNRSGYQVGLSTGPLADLYIPCIDYIEQRGGRIFLDQSISNISSQGNNISSLTLQDGKSVTAENYITTVPFDILRKLLPENYTSHPYFSRTNELSMSPITSVHVWFDRPVTDLDYAAVIGKKIQWIFNQSIRKQKTSDQKDQSTYLGLVVSASDAWMKLPQNQIINQAMDDLKSILPETRKAKLLKAIVVKEGKATFAPKPGCDLLRPDPSTPLSNLFIAGDWVQTGWPATMESAVRSGYQAAEILLKTLGTPTKILKPELSLEGILKWLIQR
tara:strand:- start:39456 stop:40886 length:1431 start_codon:yes stop_codon:yes gene_type:complete